MYTKDQEFSDRKAMGNPKGGNVHYMVTWKKVQQQMIVMLPGQIICG
jgi:hypothetical protein